MSVISNLITKADVLTKSPTLFIQRNSSFSTLIGGLVSILLGISFIVCILYFGLELINKQNPYVIVSEKIFNEVGEFNFNGNTNQNDDMQIFFQLRDKNFDVISDKDIVRIT